MSPRRGKSNRRGEPSGVLEGGQIDSAVAGFFLGGAGCGAAGAGCAVEALLDFSDQIFEIVDLAGQRGRPSASRPRSPFRYRPAFSAARRSAGAMRCRSSASAAASRCSRSFSSAISRRIRTRSDEVGGERLGLHAHIRQHGAEHDGGADRRPAHPPGRTIIAGGGLRPIRCSDASTSAMAARRPSSDWRMPRSLSSSGLRRASVSAMRVFAGAQARGGVDQRLVELAAVVADARRSRA